MAKKLQKSIRIYLSKLKKIRRMSLPNPPTTTSSLLSACMYPKTLSFAAKRHQPDAADADRLLFDNFHSLCIRNDSESDPSPDAIKTSDRFFASPHTTNSLADEPRSSSSPSPSPNPDVSVPEESLAVTTLSKNPYDDFRRSMQEMVDAWHVDPPQPLDWEFMEELLFCYLELNDRSVHKHILTAFTDLAVCFRPHGSREVVLEPAARGGSDGNGDGDGGFT